MRYFKYKIYISWMKTQNCIQAEHITSVIKWSKEWAWCMNTFQGEKIQFGCSSMNERQDTDTHTHTSIHIGDFERFIILFSVSIFLKLWKPLKNIDGVSNMYWLGKLCSSLLLMLPLLYDRKWKFNRCSNDTKFVCVCDAVHGVRLLIVSSASRSVSNIQINLKPIYCDEHANALLAWLLRSKVYHIN